MSFGPGYITKTPPPPPLLDQHGGAAAACSLRLLRVGYNGPCIRVRRSSDNAEKDIGFSGGTLDTNALTSFVGNNDGYVVKWYDQSGNNRDATQSTQADQPQIVSSGTVITQNSNPTIEFDGSDDVLEISSFDVGGPGQTVFSVAKPDSSGNGYQSIITQNFDGSKQKEFGHRSHVDGPQYAGSDENGSTKFGKASSVSDKDQLGLFVSLIDTQLGQSDEYKIFYNADKKSLTYQNQRDLSGFYSVTKRVLIGDREDRLNPFKGPIQEVILYPEEKTNDRSAIESNINDHYNIY